MTDSLIAFAGAGVLFILAGAALIVAAHRTGAAR